jgi:iron complex outermembrane recepter protein
MRAATRRGARAPSDSHTVFAAVSQSFEPPTHDDLLATVNGTPNSSAGRPIPAAPDRPAAVFVTPALRAQRAVTVEAGWRGGASRLSWDVTVYYSRLRNEILSLRDESGVSLGAANAPRTRHLGVELGLTARLSQAVTGRVVYAYQDFRFSDDLILGDNRLAGAPRHWIHGTLTWRPGGRWSTQAALRWSPESTPVDNLGTLYNAPYATFDLRSEYRHTDVVTLFAEVTNLFDETYASSMLIVDQARPDQAVFLPGDGRAFGAGVRLKF